jgi:hypothetical protein
MDDALSKLERAHAREPDDATIRVELARAYVRAGRAARALAVLGALDPSEREAAGRALGAALGLAWSGVASDVDVFRTDTRSLALVHAGAFLEDGEAGLVSSLLERSSRADLRRVVLPAFLAELDFTELRGDGREAARGAGGRLPARGEWKKLWRGGLFLDGDASAQTANPDPDRLLPVNEAPIHSPYGARFDLDACEVLDGSVGGVFDQATGRYVVSLATPEQRRGRTFVWRLVRDVPRHLT